MPPNKPTNRGPYTRNLSAGLTDSRRKIRKPLRNINKGMEMILVDYKKPEWRVIENLGAKSLGKRPF